MVVGAAGAVLLLLFGRSAWAVAFSLGAAISLGNFSLIARAVAGVADPDASRASGHLWKGALFRFVVVGLALFVAVVVLRAHIFALLAGLLLTQLGMIATWLMRSMRENA